MHSEECSSAAGTPTVIKQQQSSTSSYLSLKDVLDWLNGPISEEQAWALLHQSCTCLMQCCTSRNHDEDAMNIGGGGGGGHSTLNNDLQILISVDGEVQLTQVGPQSHSTDDSNCGNSTTTSSSSVTAATVVHDLGVAIYMALDRYVSEGMERILARDLEQLIGDMVQQCVDSATAGGGAGAMMMRPSCSSTDSSFCQIIMNSSGGGKHQSDLTDDEGIGQESTETTLNLNSLSYGDVVKRCELHHASSARTAATEEEVDEYYRSQLQELVYEALDNLHDRSTLDDMSEGGVETAADYLDYKYLAERCHLWGRVMEELRQGIKLRHHHPEQCQCCVQRPPPVYQLTPYEILMQDIRSCRHKLRCVASASASASASSHPHTYATDMSNYHDVLLEWIRSRPPLKNHRRRALPPRIERPTPREQLLASIQRGTSLRPVPKPRRLLADSATSAEGVNSPGSARRLRLLKADRSLVADLYDSDGDSSSDEDISHRSAIETYDLACGAAAATAGVPHYSGGSMPSTRPNSRQDDSDYDDTDPNEERLLRALNAEYASAVVPAVPLHVVRALVYAGDLSVLPPEELRQFTLRDLMHVRIATTRRDLEKLSVEADVRRDAATSRVCFLCLKTRFGVLPGSWGRKCVLCTRTVCGRCCDQMSVTRQQFTSVPAVQLADCISGTTTVHPKQRHNHNSSTKLPSRIVGRLSRLRYVHICLDCKLIVAQLLMDTTTARH